MKFDPQQSGWPRAVLLTAQGIVSVFAILLTLAITMSSCHKNEMASPEQTGEGGTPAVFSQEELAETYASLTGFIAEAQSDKVWSQFRAQQQATIMTVDNSMRIEVTGDKPVLIAPAFAAGKRFIVEAVMDCPADTTAQLYYLTKGQASYTEGHSQKVQLKRGRNIVYFRVDLPNLMDPLRFDPATTPGVYLVRSMNAMALPPAPATK